MKRYEIPKDKIPVIIIPTVFILLICTPIIIVFFSIFDELSSTRDFILFAILSIVFIGGYTAAVGMALSTWTCVYFVELNDDKVVGYNLFKKRFEIYFDDIIIICKSKITYRMIIRTQKKEKMVIMQLINNYGECITEIANQAVNAKKIDFKDLDKNKNVWEM